MRLYIIEDFNVHQCKLYFNDSVNVSVFIYTS